MTAPSRARAAVLFDVDGTLIDSNYLHVSAWHTAFAQHGMAVDDWRTHRAIGMDGERLLDTLVPDADEDARRAVKEAHAAEYAARAGELRAFTGARDLLSRCQEIGLAVVLATSAPPDELERARSVLDCDDLVDAVTSADDVDEAKPEPGIVEVALERAGIPAERAVLVGDAMWDGHAAVRAGVTFVAVRSGGVGTDELRDAGAVEVVDDVASLADGLTTSAVGALARRP
ncbi:phosphoglycolate phosphatase-like HAD superfamily hydrolase [Mumia flava]|uniref:Phosphoglycolate phosphatase-like HAD superfamily hydrolase n=1 Tax=Mumia flava TaxID=1348852 RepID=A0A0B2B756_9ACTN|nr:HAD family hydrolase [Mumia flava]PJJ57631.1 phosphoglycolate phosphatase-like HAD superfamily hydrolase [Mumia flava]